MKWQSLTKAVWEAPSLIRSAKLAAISRIKGAEHRMPDLRFSGQVPELR